MKTAGTFVSTKVRISELLLVGQFAKQGSRWPDAQHRLANAFPSVQAATTQARRERTTMAAAATETISLIAFTLPSAPYSVQMARFYVRAALTYHELGDYSEDAVTVTSELVTNAIEHAGALKFGLEVMHLADSGAVVVIVIDHSPHPPVKRDLSEGIEHGRGLNIVDALSVSWGWRPLDPGKAVYAILVREA
jgi:anti-sigma regulatory factor (Ser/Thr protein kinase)